MSQTKVTGSGLKLSKITDLLPNLTREVLTGLEKRGWVQPAKDAYGPHGSTRRYPPDQVRTLYLAYRCYEAGLTLEQTETVLHSPATFYPPDATAFSEAVSHLLQKVLEDDAKALARAVVAEAIKILRAECVLLFLEPETFPGRLNLAAGCVYGGSFSQVHDVDPGSEYENWLARGMELTPGPEPKGTPRRVWRELKITEVQNRFTSQFAGFPKPAHLPSDEYFSWLCLPLADRKGRLFGYLVAENRIGPRGRPDKAYCFDPATEYLGKIYADFLSLLLQIVPLVMTQERLFTHSQRFRPLDLFLKEVVRIGILLTRGFRGELAVYEGDRGMVIRAHKGPITQDTRDAGKGPLDHPLPNRSASRFVYETGKPLRLDDVGKSDIYHQCHDQTKSQITIPLPFPFSDRPYGTLTIEAFRPKGFDSTDERNLEQLAAQAGFHANSIEKNTAVTELLTRFYQNADGPEAGAGPLWTVLDEVYRETGFASGIVYLADYRAARLQVMVTRGCPKIAPERLKKMWRFSDTALATKVFLEQEFYFSPDPTNDVFVNPDGLEAFEASGPLLGVPITFQRFMAGVLVVWNAGEPKPKATDVERLKLFTDLRVTSPVTSSRARQETQTLRAMQKIQASIRSNTPPREVFREILKALLIRYDRARLHQYKVDPQDGKGPYFECLFSEGGREPHKYLGQKIYQSQSPYIDDILKTPTREAVPQIYDKKKFGLDPCAYLWDRPADQAWMMTALYSQGKLWGYLTVDNAVSLRPIEDSETQGPIALYGWLAELVLAAGQATAT
jgi:GAF domain-containing protein